ncbi:MAG: hypothetical protein ABJD13_07060 [Paracoccaceae bacterium]
MPQIDRGDDIIQKRASNAIAAQKDKIIAEFIAGAKTRGHDIPVDAVTSVTLKRIESLKISVENFHVFPFVIEQTDLHTYLDSVTYINNASNPANVDFEVDKTTGDTFSWTMITGTKAPIRASGSVTIDLPHSPQERIGTDVSINATLTTAAGTAHATAHRWKHSFSHPVAPFTQFKRDIYGLQVSGYAPYSIKARASGRAEILIEFSYHGAQRKHVASVLLGRLLGEAGTSLEQSGRIDGVQGYDEYFVDSHDRPLTEAERRNMPMGLHEMQFSYQELRLEDESSVIQFERAVA